MQTETNKAAIRDAMDALAEGDTRPFGALMAEDFAWHMIGSTAWSGSYRGRAEVRERLFRNLFAQFATTYRKRPLRILADGDYVAVECRGEVTTTTGRPYNNSYCYVIRMADGLMAELTEYMDTALVETALEPPPAAT